MVDNFLSAGTQDDDELPSPYGTGPKNRTTEEHRRSDYGDDTWRDRGNGLGLDPSPSLPNAPRSYERGPVPQQPYVPKPPFLPASRRHRPRSNPSSSGTATSRSPVRTATNHRAARTATSNGRSTTATPPAPNPPAASPRVVSRVEVNSVAVSSRAANPVAANPVEVSPVEVTSVAVNPRAVSPRVVSSVAVTSSR